MERWRYLSPHSDVDLFHVSAGPVARVVLALGSGWSSITRDGWRATRSVRDTAELTAVSLATDTRSSTAATGTTTVTFRLVPSDGAATVEVRDGGAVLASFDVARGGTDVSVDLPVDRTVHLVVAAGAGPVAIGHIGVETAAP